MRPPFSLGEGSAPDMTKECAGKGEVTEWAGSGLTPNRQNGERIHMTTVRFLHTADWQLGMTRHFFSEGVQERYSQARFDAIRKLGQLAKDEDCSFVLVCGDTFESNQVDRRTVARACEALKEIPVPVFILPANHDPLNAASVFQSSTFTEQKPDHVKVIEDTAPLEISSGVELVGAPWRSKKPAKNPLHELLETLPVSGPMVRVVAGHGVADAFTPDKDAPAVLSVDELDHAIHEGKANFIALGDRHSATRLGAGDRIWYSGTPVSTDFREDNSGRALVVEVEAGNVNVQEHVVGDWRFTEFDHVDVNGADDLNNLTRTIDAIANKERTVVRLRLFGGLTLGLRVQLDTILQSAADLFAGFDVRDDDVVVMPDDADFSDLGFSGFAEKTVSRLRQQIEADRSDADQARDALMLLMRLSGGAA